LLPKLSGGRTAGREPCPAYDRVRVDLRTLAPGRIKAEGSGPRFWLEKSRRVTPCSGKPQHTSQKGRKCKRHVTVALHLGLGGQRAPPVGLEPTNFGLEVGRLTPDLPCAEMGHRAVIAQLAARRSHNPKVVSSILTHRNSSSQHK
jgi:hypothetical protein